MTATQKPPGAGRSSFELIDRERFFRELPLKKSTVFLDLGCGRGEYAIPIRTCAEDPGRKPGGESVRFSCSDFLGFSTTGVSPWVSIAEAIGPEGKVYGVDARTEGLAHLSERALSLGLMNIETLAADVNRGIPLRDQMVDVAFMATVLHDLLRDNTGEVVLRGAARVLKPEGKLVIVEYKKIETPSGPPVTMRLSEQELGEITARFGFRMDRVSEVGPYHYLFIASMPE
jgi:ubiquinone/menaquinone biosynthesis C-methylase UbiE